MLGQGGALLPRDMASAVHGLRQQRVHTPRVLSARRMPEDRRSSPAGRKLRERESAFVAKG
eukprot:307903-Alexandrium_andersonii.AAC.1